MMSEVGGRGGSQGRGWREGRGRVMRATGAKAVSVAGADTCTSQLAAASLLLRGLWPQVSLPTTGLVACTLGKP